MLKNGGAEVSLCRIANMLSKDGHLVYVITLAEERNYRSLLDSNIVYDYIIHDSRRKSLIRYFLRALNFMRRKHVGNLLLRKLNRIDADVAFTFNEFEKCLIPLSKSNAHMKICWFRHDISDYHQCERIIKEDRELFKNLFMQMDQLLFVTHQSMDNYIDIFPEFKDRCSYLLNSIDIGKINELSKENSIARPEDKVVFSCVARLSYEKGQDMLYEAAGYLDKNGYQGKYEIWLIGDYTDKKYVINPKGIETTNIRRLGRKDNPYPYMKQADVLICSSRSEGCPNVILEAMALGIPIISTRTSGGVELLGNGSYGILCDINSRSIADAMVEMLNENTRLHYSEIAEERGNYYSNEVFLSRINTILNKQTVRGK